MYSIIVLCCTIGFFRYDIFIEKFNNTSLSNFINQTVEVEGVVSNEPIEKERGVRYTVQLQDVQVVLTDQLYSEIIYGDKVLVRGLLVEPENFQAENGHEFQYKQYLQKDNILFEIKNPQVTFIAHHQGNKIKELLFAVKNKFVENITDAISYPESSFAAGITIAGKKALPPSLETEFQRTGTLQVVVLSGYNITIVAEAFVALTSFLPSFFSAVVGVGGIILFTIMAGGSATVVRGSVMVIVAISAKLLRRKYDVTRSLTLAAFLMLGLNPMLLVFDPSFQLSFLATLGLILVSPMVEKHLGWITERLGLRQVVAATLATQIFVTPFILYTSGDLSFVAVPANLLLFLFIPTTMFFCFVTGMMGFIHHVLTIPFSFLSFLFLKYELTVIHIFSSFSFALVTIHSFPLWLMTLVYIGYGVFIRRFYRDHKT